MVQGRQILMFFSADVMDAQFFDILFQQCLCQWLCLEASKPHGKVLEAEPTGNIEQFLHSLVRGEVDL